MANITCPPRNQLPTPSSIDSDVNYVLRAGTNTSDPAMTACCAPNPVNFIDGCFLWCEYPNRYSNDSLAEFSACIRENGGEEAAVIREGQPNSRHETTERETRPGHCSHLRYTHSIRDVPNKSSNHDCKKS